jgi:uncharacterized membrane protein
MNDELLNKISKWMIADGLFILLVCILTFAFGNIKMKQN